MYGAKFPILQNFQFAIVGEWEQKLPERTDKSWHIP